MWAGSTDSSRFSWVPAGRPAEGPAEDRQGSIRAQTWPPWPPSSLPACLPCPQCLHLCSCPPPTQLGIYLPCTQQPPGLRLTEKRALSAGEAKLMREQPGATTAFSAATWGRHAQDRNHTEEGRVKGQQATVTLLEPRTYRGETCTGVCPCTSCTWRHECLTSNRKRKRTGVCRVRSGGQVPPAGASRCAASGGSGCTSQCR